jgi:hypothetical protein
MQADGRALDDADARDFKGSLLAAFAVLIFAPALAPLAGWLAPHWPTGLVLGISGAAMVGATGWLAWQLGRAAYRAAAERGFAEPAETQLPSA